MTLGGLVEEFKVRSKRAQLRGSTAEAVAYLEAAIALKRELNKITSIEPEDTELGFV